MGKKSIGIWMAAVAAMIIGWLIFVIAATREVREMPLEPTAKEQGIDVAAEMNVWQRPIPSVGAAADILDTYTMHLLGVDVRKSVPDMDVGNIRRMDTAYVGTSGRQGDEEIHITSGDGQDETAEKDMPGAEEIRELAVCVEAEAGDQPLVGRQMVADVILNRVREHDWPNTIREVIEQPYQFSSFWDGGMDRVEEPSEETWTVVYAELEEVGYPGLLYFRMGRYHEWGTPWRKIGDHYFSTR